MGHRGRSIVTLFALAALAGLVTACTSSEQGTPTAAPGATGQSSSSTTPPAPPPSSPSSPTAPSTRPIPKQVDLTKVKPCALFTSAVSVLAGTAGDDDTPQEDEVTSLPDATGCFQVNDKNNVGLTIAVATSTAVDSFAQNPAYQVQQFTVQGFPAVVVVPKGVPACFGGIGMADHQMVYLRYGLANPASSPQVPQGQLCARIRPIAEQVVAQLNH